MSSIIITSTDCPGVPRLSDVTLGIVEDEEETYDKEFFCPQGHAFALTFANEVAAPSFWECPTCETLAPDFPPNAF